MARSDSESPTGIPDHANVVVLPPVLYLGALVAGLLTQTAIGGTVFGAILPRVLIGVPLVLLGAVGSVLFARQFEDAGQGKDPLSPTSTIIRDGVFAWSRNPAYVSLTFVYLGLAVLLNNLWMFVYLVPVLVLMHYGVILREERYLEMKFGEEYLDYKSKVRRWI